MQLGLNPSSLVLTLFTLEAVDDFQKDSIFLLWSILTRDYSETSDDNGKCAENGKCVSVALPSVTTKSKQPLRPSGQESVSPVSPLSASDDFRDYTKKNGIPVFIFILGGYRGIRSPKIYKGNLRNCSSNNLIVWSKYETWDGRRRLCYKSKWEYGFKKRTVCWRLTELSDERQRSRCSDTLRARGYRGDLVPPLHRGVSVLRQTRGEDFCSPGSRVGRCAEWRHMGRPKSLVLCFLYYYYYSRVLLLPRGMLIEKLLPVDFWGPKWQALAELSSHLLKQRSNYLQPAGIESSFYWGKGAKCFAVWMNNPKIPLCRVCVRSSHSPSVIAMLCWHHLGL